MNHKTRAELNHHIAEQAAEWFIEFRSGDIDQEGRRAFQEWVRSSPEHLRAYLEYAAIWNEGDSIDVRREVDVAAAISSAKENRNVIPMDYAGGELGSRSEPEGRSEREGRSQRKRRSGREPIAYRKMASAAAIVVMLAGLASVGYSQLSRSRTYSTEVGEQRSIRLPDGSTVELNSRSRLRASFSGKTERAVEMLEGQALFRVAKDPYRPFIVRSNGMQIRAVGTQFDVNRKRADTIVTVLEGKVAISSGAVNVPVPRIVGVAPATAAAALYLSAGEQVTVRGKSVRAPIRANTVATTAWTQRQLVLESAPLRAVAEEFNRYSNRKLVAEESAVEELRLSGVFATDPNFLLRYLRARSDITVVETEAEIRILHHD